MTSLTALSDMDFKYKRSSVKLHAMQSYKERTFPAYSSEQRTWADIRFPPVSSDSTFQRCLSTVDKFKLFFLSPASPLWVHFVPFVKLQTFSEKKNATKWSPRNKEHDWVGMCAHTICTAHGPADERDAFPSPLLREHSLRSVNPHYLQWGSNRLNLED